MHAFEYLSDVLILLTASIFVVITLYRFKLSPVLGYLMVGALIGDHGFKLIEAPEYISAISDFGVVFLLFMIGLKLTFDRLVKMRLHVFGFGSLQIFLTAPLLAFLFDYFYEEQTSVDIVLGCTLALSSTAIVLQVLSDSGRQSTQVGRLSLAVLLMQDFALVPLLAVLPVMSGSGDGDLLYTIGIAGLKAFAAIIGITIIGRLLLRPFFSLIASVKTDEVYVTTALLLVLGAAWLTNKLGLSSAMGAFIAGMLIAETEYRNKIEDSISPFQGLFLSLFFLTVGMSIDASLFIYNWKNIIIGALLLIFIKSFIITLLSRAFKFSWGAAIHSGLLLSQGSEFAFVLLGLAKSMGIIDSQFGEFILIVVAVSMAVTPLLSILGGKIEDIIDLIDEKDQLQEFKGVSDLSNHVIIAGFGRVGRVVAHILAEENIDSIIVDTNSSTVKNARSHGQQIYKGDISDEEILKAVGSERASAIILTMSDKTSIRKAVKVIAKSSFKDLKIITRAEDSNHGKKLRKLGASATIPATIETGLQIAGVALKHLDIVDHEIINIKEKMRKYDYAITEELELFKSSDL